MNKILRSLSVLVVLIAVAGCSTPASRIQNHQAAFDAWPAAVQQEVRAGRAGIGFTPEMVQVALGEADRRYTRTSLQGTSEVWVYLDHGPKFSIGVGLGGYSGNSAYGVGMRTGDDTFRENENLRVVFEGGRVVALETRKK